MVQNFIELQRNEVIDLRDTSVDRRVGVARKGHLPRNNLGDELLDHVFPAFAGSCLAAEPSFFNNLIQQAAFGGLSGGLRGCCCLFRLIHRRSPCPYSLPNSFFRRSSFSVLPAASMSNSSSLSLPCKAPRRSLNFVRRSSNSFKGFTCLATCVGSKSSRLLKSRSTLSWPAFGSSLSLLSTAKETCGLKLSRTLSKLSGVISTNRRSFIRAKGSLGWPLRSAITPITNGSSFTSMASPTSTS